MSATIEAPTRIEPCLLDETPAEIVDLVASLAGAAHRLGARLHPRSADSLAELVRVMNCYYSNPIEGHNTTPREIERALQNQLDTAEERRNLQIEARAHIRLQREVDSRMRSASCRSRPLSTSSVAASLLLRGCPEPMLRIEGAPAAHDSRQFRTAADHEVAVGRHLPPAGERVEDFMAHFERRYRFQSLGIGSRITAMAAAHHRSTHSPFPRRQWPRQPPDEPCHGAERRIGAHGLWSVSRGLARGLESRGDYKRMMDHADMPRQGDLDGRGNLSRKALSEFTAWFLKVCLDQVTLMSGLFALDTLVDRLKVYVSRRELKPEALRLLEQTLQRGSCRAARPPGHRA